MPTKGLFLPYNMIPGEQRVDHGRVHEHVLSRVAVVALIRVANGDLVAEDVGQDVAGSAKHLDQGLVLWCQVSVFLKHS